MYDVVLFGEPMALFVANEYGSLEDVNSYTRSVSGAEVNVSIGLTRLGHNVAYITRVGDDPLGNFIINFLKEKGLDITHISKDSSFKTGIQLKNKVKDGDSYAPYFRKNSAATNISFDVIDSIDFSKLRLLHITGIPLALSESFRNLIKIALSKAREHNVIVTFDPNIRKDLWDSEQICKLTILEIAKQCDYFFPGLNEVEYLTGIKDVETAYDYFNAQGIKNVIIKAGAKGTHYLENGIICTIPRIKVKQIVDTVGAGDGFAAGMISGILDGLSLRECVINANAVGAIQVEHWSDNENLPTKEALKNYLEGSVYEE